MSASHGKKLRLLSTLHLLTMVGIGIWWGTYFWQHSPTRIVWGTTDRVSEGTNVSTTLTLERGFRRLGVAARIAGPDLLFGLSTLALFAIGTGVYVRRIEIWLQARTSGQAVSFGAGNLEGQALLANDANRRRTP
jgi:hypothetical protein